MLTLAYIRDKADWRDRVCLIFSDLIACRNPGFVLLRADDLVLTLEPHKRQPGLEQWVLRRVFRVSKFEETGDAFVFDLDLQCTLSPPGDAPLWTVSRFELLWAENWVAEPEEFFKPFPRAVWRWLRNAKRVPLSDVVWDE